MAKISNTNGFRAMATLRKAATDPRVAEIEGAGMDEGRVFIHLHEGFWFAPYRGGTHSVGSAAEIREALAMIEPQPAGSTS